MTPLQRKMSNMGKAGRGASKRRSTAHYRKAQAVMVASVRAKKIARGRAALGLPPI